MKNIDTSRAYSLELFPLTLAFALGASGCGGAVTDEESSEPTESTESTESTEVAAVLAGCSGSICTVDNTATQFYVPPHVGGDRDYHGNGPDVQVSVELWTSGPQVWATVYVNALETRSDWTEVDGARSYLLHTASGSIAEILSATGADWSYVDYNHQLDVRSFGWGRFECVGDTRGNEAGTRTGCKALFHQIRYRLE